MIDCGLASFMQLGRVAEGAAAVEAETEGRTRAAEYFMQKLAWQLLVSVYSLPDVWQHYHWAAPENTPERERLNEGYRLMDCHLARLLHYLPADGRIIICSDHGFGPLTGTRDSLNRWLADQGLLRYQTGKVQTPLARLSSQLLRQLRQRVSFRRRQQWLAALPKLRRLVESQLRIGGIDWPNTKAYAALDHQELWLNMRGRQPQGRVEPADYDALCGQLSEALLAWREPETGRAYIKAVHRQPHHLQPADGIILPDLLLEWDEAVPAQPLHPLINGDHTPDGAWIIAGAGVKSQRLPDHSLTDVAPLALQLLGLPIPAWMTGQAPTDLLCE
jgi:predicted AlkP superfamily phosphohydrolase/phosphomutase